MKGHNMLGMKQLSTSDRAHVLQLLCEGMAIRAVCRATGVAKNTVAKLLADVGRACMAYHDEHARNLKCKTIQVDEAWSFIYAKQKNVARPKRLPKALAMFGLGSRWMPRRSSSHPTLSADATANARNGSLKTLRRGSPIASN